MKQFEISHEQVSFLLAHLRQESKLLDAAIVAGIEVKKMLRAQRNDASIKSQEGEVTETSSFAQIDRNEQVRKRLAKMQQQIAATSAPVVINRKKLTAFLAAIAPAGAASVSLSSLARSIEDPRRSELLKLKEGVKQKYQQFYAISMSNQTVLVYTLSYYDQLLGSSNRGDFYNANGQTQASSPKTNYVKASC
jgi:hypothetical protein